MPPESVQRGTAKKGDGDPFSPFYPAKPELYYSKTIEDLKAEHIIPAIPAIPLGYGDVYNIISQMGGHSAPKEWQGGLNVTYKLGPGLINNQKLEIEVHSTIEKREIQNVIGYLKGLKETDRFVMLSNHYDAWSYGSMDPNSGTAIMAEVARAMVQAKNDGVFKPLRSIMFCAWDSEEFGLMGSNEFAEEFTHFLSQRVVALLNVDLISGNSTLKLEAVPTLYNTVMEAARAIDTPLEAEKAAGRKSIYDTWYHRTPGSNPIYPELPSIGAPNDGSDHATYMSYIGIPVVDFTYLRHNDNPLTNRTYPLYHTLYETPFTNEHLFDTNNFAVHKIDQLDPKALTDLQIRDINDRIMLAERCFIVPTGMPNAPIHRNVLFSFANHNAYAASIMPGIYDTITALEQAETEEDRLKLGGELAEQVSHLQHSVQCASSSLLSDP
ncbi:hypothetical protein M3Y97_00268800 [Aphelenchoides bicaudatus]|nr:hypothetical protein M3Y97_00268800 [Aphelenchoides bicaudatus]